LKPPAKLAAFVCARVVTGLRPVQVEQSTFWVAQRVVRQSFKTLIAATKGSKGNLLRGDFHMTNLAALTRKDFAFFAVPVKVKGFGTFPVRAFAIL
jgi:hypothetical protein